MSVPSPRLHLSRITKAYPGVVANDAIDLVVQPGEIHAVLGENGAGKSTLMKIIYGAVQPDSGGMAVDGRSVHLSSPQQARALGIRNWSTNTRSTTFTHPLSFTSRDLTSVRRISMPFSASNSCASSIG